MDDLCCVFPVYSNVVLWLAVCPRQSVDVITEQSVLVGRPVDAADWL